MNVKNLKRALESIPDETEVVVGVNYCEYDATLEESRDCYKVVDNISIPWCYDNKVFIHIILDS